ncbi:hypothetical protein O1L60_20820 [Streptomyces diastatochromogenes]|nr:hypothetical protein [Streptomyces diastatochromogenes]
MNAAALGALATRATTEPMRSAAQAPTDTRPKEPRTPTATRPKRIRTLLAPAVDNWLARAYLAVVAAALGFFLCATFVLPDPGFAGIWPLMATAPFSLLALAASAPFEVLPSPTWTAPLLFSLGTALSGLLNAVLLGLLSHRLRSRAPRPAV